jgi:hypothetical protein
MREDGIVKPAARTGGLKKASLFVLELVLV